jgi:hypothetical protein
VIGLQERVGDDNVIRCVSCFVQPFFEPFSIREMILRRILERRSIVKIT